MLKLKITSKLMLKNVKKEEWLKKNYEISKKNQKMLKNVNNC